MYAGDVDGDGDLDVLASAYDRTIVWYENIDGKGTFGSRNVIATDSDYASVFAVDVDGDGVLDVLSTSAGDDKIAWYENLSNPPARKIGDSNGDGIFNSSDLIVVFQAGEYEDGIPQNSTFEEGDWNGDGEFDTTDLVLAFQQGTYVSAAQRATETDIGSSLARDAVRGRQETNPERTTQRTPSRSPQPIAPARRWDVTHVDRVFAEHAGTDARGLGEMSHGTILDAMPGILDVAIV